MCRALLFCSWLLVIALGSVANAALRPVVVIPGTMGSKLCDRSGSVIWGDRSSYTAARMNALRLPFDTSKRDLSIHSCGLIESVSIIPLLWESNVYSTLLKTLSDIGYKPDDILIFDYDWRLSNFENAERLRDGIEKRFAGRGGKVDIVAHSMGGIIARIYVQSLGGDRRFQNLVMLGTPHRGSAAIFERLLRGFEHWPSALSGGVAEIQRTVLSLPSTYQLLPTYRECCGFSKTVDPVNAKYADILSADTWSRFGWLPAEFKSNDGRRFLDKSLAETVQLKQLLEQPIVRDIDAFARLRFIANGFLDTWSRVFFDPTSGAIVGNTMSPGDGTVLLFSATNGLPAQFQASLKEHAAVFSGREPELVIKATLSDQSFHKGPADFSQQLVDDNKNTVEISRASLSLEPRVVTPNGKLAVSVSLTGRDELRNSSFSNIRADIVRDGTVLNTYALRERSSPQPDKKILSEEFAAPSATGSYLVRVNVPGVESFELIFGVIQ
jgi:pimeloyl-ACP methyl ester carboxylesterase